MLGTELFYETNYLTIFSLHITYGAHLKLTLAKCCLAGQLLYSSYNSIAKSKSIWGRVSNLNVHAKNHACVGY